MIIDYDGEEANGKTTALYTGPLPAVGFQFDMGWQRALQGSMSSLFAGLTIEGVPYDKTAPALPVWKTNGADITIFEMPPPIQLDNIRVKGARELWDKFIILMTEALGDFNIQNIAVDTMTIARRVKSDAYLQTLQEKWFQEHPNEAAAGETVARNNPQDRMRERLLQIEYGPVNDAIRDIYTTCQGLHRNLSVSHHLTDERIPEKVRQQNGDVKTESVLTGRRILEGLAQTHRYVDVAMRMTKQKQGDKMIIVGEFIKCGYNLDLEGTKVNNPNWNGIANLIELSIGGGVELPKRVMPVAQS